MISDGSGLVCFGLVKLCLFKAYCLSSLVLGFLRSSHHEAAGNGS